MTPPVHIMTAHQRIVAGAGSGRPDRQQQQQRWAESFLAHVQSRQELQFFELSLERAAAGRVGSSNKNTRPEASRSRPASSIASIRLVRANNNGLGQKRAAANRSSSNNRPKASQIQHQWEPQVLLLPQQQQAKSFSLTTSLGKSLDSSGKTRAGITGPEKA